MPIREAGTDDWPRIRPPWRRIVVTGETYTWDPDPSEEDARVLWMNPAKARTGRAARHVPGAATRPAAPLRGGRRAGS
ncbi:hypothetical protein GCM10027073_52980 [Streptomyces chlorus]